MGQILINSKLNSKYQRELAYVCEGCPIYLNNIFGEVSTKVEDYWKKLTETEQESLIIRAGDEKAYLPIIVEKSMGKNEFDNG